MNPTQQRYLLLWNNGVYSSKHSDTFTVSEVKLLFCELLDSQQNLIAHCDDPCGHDKLLEHSTVDDVIAAMIDAGHCGGRVCIVEPALAERGDDYVEASLVAV